MSVTAWRIAIEAPAYSACDMTGAGAKLTGGRWNSIGTPMLYCSSNIALAVLETISSLRSGSLPFNRFLVQFDIPDRVWAAREELRPPPGGWDAVPSGRISKLTGDAWIAAATSALLAAPSVMVPEESNILMNPLHPDASAIKATTVRKWIYDQRLI